MPSHDGSILICLSPAPSNRIIIEAAAGMHRSKDAALIALFIETPGYEQLSDRDKQRLNANMALARTFGAEIEVVSGVDIPFQIAEYARRQDIFRIVMGQGIVPHSRLLPVQDFAEELLRYLPEAELHIIPDGSRKAHYRPHEDDRSSREQILVDLLFSLLILSVATLLGTLFDSLHFSDSTIMMSYLLGVLLISIGTSHRGYSLVAAVVSILLFNYFFVQPRFSLQVLESGYPVTLLVMFLTSFITGTLAVRLKSAARQAAQTAYRTKIISDTDQMLAKCSGKSEILDVCSRQVQKLLSQPFQLQSHDDGVCLAVSEFESSDSLANFPLQSKSRIYAVLSVDVSRKPIEVAEHGILLSILGECTLALENEQNAREKEEATVQIENERMRSTLLRAISHDLRTPLTSISGNASNLLSHENDFDAPTRRSIYHSIYEDSLWLNQVVENLLASTRLENGEAQLYFSTEVLEDIIVESVSHILSFSGSHKIVIEPSDELILVKADSRLITQVLINLLNNAIKYTPDGSTIRIRTQKRASSACVSVADNGPGVPDSDKARVFDMFYTGSQNISDSRRSLGFGLALCKTIIQAHGGEISVSDNVPHGAIFTFCLPAEEVSLNG